MTVLLGKEEIIVVGNIKPIYKANDKQIVSNYRLISNIVKIFNKVEGKIEF